GPRISRTHGVKRYGRVRLKLRCAERMPKSRFDLAGLKKNVRELQVRLHKVRCEIEQLTSLLFSALQIAGLIKRPCRKHLGPQRKRVQPLGLKKFDHSLFYSSGTDQNGGQPFMAERVIGIKIDRCSVFALGPFPITDV